MKINIVQITSKTRLELALMYYLCHDLVNLLLYTLEDLGHDVVFQKDQFDPECLNIIVTGYHLSAREVEVLRNRNIPYIVYQAEIFTPMGLNNDDPALVPAMMDIQNNYLQLVEGALHVWDCFKFNQQFLMERGVEKLLCSAWVSSDA